MKHRAKVLNGIATILTSLVILVFAAVITSCNDNNDTNAVNNGPYTISGNASGSQMVPSVTGTGTGTISGTYDPATRNLTYSSSWNGLTGAPTAGGFYSGASGATGPAVGTPWTFTSNATGTGTTAGTMTLTEEQATQFIKGNWYYSYGTATNPTGEVRGQIMATR